MAHSDTTDLVRALEAERLHPVPPPPHRPGRRMPPEALAEVLEEAAGEPTQQQTEAAARLEDYMFLRDQDEDLEIAARRVGISPATARKSYEPQWRKNRSTQQ
ncbi:hypothetical protein GCM10010402_66370 [Actinomadura luteofluorescens]|uniref:hypothetical protein n=1 Tax=Actinomadura luteofluorescens TaxID=46163 RepID=UPI00216429EF|nr:hypothetical protein [Actinomadura glauciflava]MCR3744191.1 hypothetical protein [Actinomadura glauciflava]